MSAPQSTNGHSSVSRSGDSNEARGQLILIPKQLRLEWIELMAADPALSNAAFRVAVAIGRHFNRVSGDTFVTQTTIARILGVSARTVWAAISELENRGYIVVTRRELGRRKSDGRRSCGGRGTSNVYAPAVEHDPIVATSQLQKLAARCEQIWLDRSQPIATSMPPKDVTDCDLSNDIGSNKLRPLTEQRSQIRAVKDATSCDPTYTDNLNGLGGSETASDMSNRLRRRITAKEYERTFAQCTFYRGPPVTLEFPSQLLCGNAINRCGPKLHEIFGADVRIVVART